MNDEFITFEQYTKKHKLLFSSMDLVLPDLKKYFYKNKVKKTEMYRNCLISYRRLLDNLSKIINNTSIDNSLDLALLYIILLDEGILSISNKFNSTDNNSHNFIIEPDDILGAKILFGNGVCRHITKNFIDIAHYCKFVAYYITCKLLDKDVYHALVGLIINNESFFFDLYNFEIGSFVDKNTIICINLLDNEKFSCYKINYCNPIIYKMVLKDRNYLNVRDFIHSSPKKSFDPIQLAYHMKYVLNIFDKFEIDFKTFKNTNKSDYELVCKMQNKICGYGKYIK